MLKKILVAVLLAPLIALAQSYPSPTFNNLTVNGTSSLAGLISGAGVTALFASPPAIGSTTAAAGSFTNLSSSGTVSGAGFTSLLSPYALLASPTFTGTPAAPTAAAGTSTTQVATTAFLTQPGPIGSGTANTGAFTTLSATGAFTPSQTAGIVGTTTNNNANAGSVGEHPIATSGSTALTTGTSTNLASISLTAGDWDVSGSAYFSPAGSTVISYIIGGISSTSATLPALPRYFQFPGPTAAGLNMGSPVPSQRFSLSATTTIYLVVQTGFTTSTLNATGEIRARRVR